MFNSQQSYLFFRIKEKNNMFFLKIYENNS